MIVWYGYYPIGTLPIVTCACTREGRLHSFPYLECTTIRASVANKHYFSQTLLWFLHYQGLGAWPYIGSSLLKVN